MSAVGLPRRGDEALTKKIHYLDDDELRSLSTYKYHGVDKSIVTEYVFEPFWNFLVDHVIPRNISANMLTLIGLICNIVSLVWCLLANDLGRSHAPQWIYPVFAILNMVYQHLDGVDGKQARKTGTASPLGQLFDHGVDAICSGFHPFIVMFAFEMYDTVLGMMVILITPLAFAIYTYEEYNTKVLRLDKFSGPVEGLIIMQIVLIITGIFGSEVFTSPLFTVGFRIPLCSVPFENNEQVVSLRDIIFFFIFASAVFMIIDSFIHTYKALRERIREEDEIRYLETIASEGNVAEETDVTGLSLYARNKLTEYCQTKYRDTPIMFKTIGYERYSAPEGVVPDCHPLIYMIKNYIIIFTPYIIILIATILGAEKARLSSILMLNFSYANLTLRVILGRLCNMKADEMVLPFYKKMGKIHRNLIFEFIFVILIIVSLFAPSVAPGLYRFTALLTFLVLAEFVLFLVFQVSDFLGIPILRMKRKE